MKRVDVERAADEARRFLRAVDDYRRRVASEPGLDNSIHSGVGVRESGAVRRASMDLTRALARMRKGGSQ